MGGGGGEDKCINNLFHRYTLIECYLFFPENLERKEELNYIEANTILKSIPNYVMYTSEISATTIVALKSINRKV